MKISTISIDIEYIILYDIETIVKYLDPVILKITQHWRKVTICDCGMECDDSDSIHVDTQSCIEWLGIQLGKLSERNKSHENGALERDKVIEARFAEIELKYALLENKIETKRKGEEDEALYNARIVRKLRKFVRANTDDGREMIPLSTLRRMLRRTRKT